MKSAIYWRDEVGYPRDGILMTDSGGYQIGSSNRSGKSAKISPRASLRWQERNADIAFNLDVPLTNDSDFEVNLQKSLENYALFARERENYEMKLYNVLHGHNLIQFENWLSTVRDFEFDGWAIGSGSNIYVKVLAYLVLHEQDAPNLNGNIHFSGTSSLTSMLAFSMLSNRFSTSITFDSSSYITGAKYRDWLPPMSIRQPVQVGKAAQNRMEVNPCGCPICRVCTIDDLYSQTNRATPMLLSLHNLYQFIAVNDFINRLVEDEDALQQYAESNRELKLVQNIDGMFEEYDRNGYHGVYDRYKAILEKKPEKPTKKVSSPPTILPAIASNPVPG
jgi:tRNA-guanine family transglycosylase